MRQIPEFAPAHVSVVNEFPEDLYDAMRNFVRTHPNWDQYRLMQVAVAGFLFQQGCRERAVARHYLDGLFDRGGAAVPVAEPLPGPPQDREQAAAAVTPQLAVTPPPAVTPLRPRPGTSAGASAAPRPLPKSQPQPHHPAASSVARRAA